MMVMHVVMMMVMMMMMHGSRHRGGGGRRGVLRNGVAGEAERQNRRGGKGLDHGGTFLWLGTRTGQRDS
jgi:hypothetical protein